MSEISENKIKSMTKEQNYMRGYADGKSDVLDKIRAEVEAYQSDAFYPDDVMMNRRMVLEIIDKYRESEVEK